MSQETYEKYRDPYIFDAVRMYGVKAISKILEHVESLIDFLPGENITEKDIRKNRAELQEVFDDSVSSPTRETDTRPSTSPRSATKLQELEERVSRIEKLLDSPVSLTYSGSPHALTVRLPEQLYSELQRVKNTTGESINALISKAVAVMVSTKRY